MSKLRHFASGSERAEVAAARAEFNSVCVRLDRARAKETAGRGYGGKIREILRLEFELAADSSQRRCDQSAANVLKMLAESTRHVDLAVLLAYAKLLDEIGDPATSSDLLRQIGARWFADNATVEVKQLVSIPKAGQRNL